jgi:hypothetical protein
LGDQRHLPLPLVQPAERHTQRRPQDPVQRGLRCSCLSKPPAGHLPLPQPLAHPPSQRQQRHGHQCRPPRAPGDHLCCTKSPGPPAGSYWHHWSCGLRLAPAVVPAVFPDSPSTTAANLSHSAAAAAAAQTLHAPAPAPLVYQCPAASNSSSNASRSNSSGSADAAGATCSIAAQPNALFWHLAQQYRHRLQLQQQIRLCSTIGGRIELRLRTVYEGREHCISRSTVALVAAAGVAGSIVWVSAACEFPGCCHVNRLSVCVCVL